jgi:hypothetical protein
MAVSKRLRFEILRRDKNKCRYCGRSAPGVALAVDHVIPIALGGGDEPANLVTACQDCNGGKSSASPDATVVADVSQDAVRWSAAIRQAAEENRLHDNTPVYEAVVSAWTSYRRNQIPADYRETIEQFLQAGLSAEDIVEMARVADAKPSVYNRWAYFCGCCWTRIRTLQERATEILGGNLPKPQTLLTTRWTTEEIDSLVLFEEKLANNWLVQDSIESAFCQHKSWGEGDCGDPVCRVQRAAGLGWMTYTNMLRSDRGDAIAAAAEDLDG